MLCKTASWKPEKKGEEFKWVKVCVCVCVCVYVYRTELARNRVVNAIKSLQFPQKSGEFLEHQMVY